MSMEAFRDTLALTVSMSDTLEFILVPYNIVTGPPAITNLSRSVVTERQLMHL